MKDLRSVSVKEQKSFFDSIDWILCDVDGVVWRALEPIPGAKDAISTFKNLNKKVKFISNNTTMSQETYYNLLQKAGYNLEKSDVIQPIQAIVSYFKKINFTKEIFLLGMTPLRTALENEGFKIFQYEPEILESLPEYLLHCLKTSDKVGAVVIDFDLNLNSCKLQIGAVHLKNSEILFICGGADDKYCAAGGVETIGPGVFVRILEDITGRVATSLAKPSTQYGNFIIDLCKVEDPERVLFIGDTIAEDMAFATKANFQKLLVLTGVTKQEDVINWKFPDVFKPKYYVDSLQTVQNILTFQLKRLNNISVNSYLHVVAMVDLGRTNKDVKQSFLESFDYVLFNLEDILWNSNCDISSIKNIINKFRFLDKKLLFVSNNNLSSRDALYNQLQSVGLNIKNDEIVQPSQAIISYLKRIKMSKEIFVTGMTPLRTSLEEAGFKIVNKIPHKPTDDSNQYVRNCLSISKTVGAVICDWDLNWFRPGSQNTFQYLQNPDILFITGGSERTLRISTGEEIMGPGVFHDMLEDVSGRSSLNLAKPSADFGDFIVENYQISNYRRVLIIAESNLQDLQFAANCGFKPMLILEGFQKNRDVSKTPESFTSEYFIDSYRTLDDLLQLS